MLLTWWVTPCSRPRELSICSWVNHIRVRPARRAPSGESNPCLLTWANPADGENAAAKSAATVKVTARHNLFLGKRSERSFGSLTL